MILDTTLKVLELILGAAKTTNDCEFTADYVDTQNGATFAPGGNIGLSNGTTLVAALAAPAAATQRAVRAFTFFNADTVNTTVTVRLYDGTNRRRIVAIALTPGQSLVFTPEAGWSVLPATNGQIPGTITNDSAAPGNVGELITTVNAGTPGSGLLSATPTDIGSLTLTAGDWDVRGSGGMTPTAGTTTTQFLLWLNTASATIPTYPADLLPFVANVIPATTGAGSDASLSSAAVSVAKGTTKIIYLGVYAVFSGGSGVGLQGYAQARRVR